LARQIVKEAGLQRDPEIERVREDMRGRLETLRHTSTLDAATAVALLLVQRARELDERLVAVTVGTVGVSFPLS